MTPGGQPKKVAVEDRRRRAQRDRENPACQRWHDRSKARPEREGIRIRVPGRDLRQQHRRQARETHHQHAVAGAKRQFQSGRADAGVRRRKGQQLERLYDVADARERAVPLRLDSAEGRSRWSQLRRRNFSPRSRRTARRSPTSRTGRRSRSTTSRRSSPARCCPRISITRTPTATSTTPGRPTRSGCWCSSLPASGCSRPKSESSLPMAPRRCATSPKAATTTPRRNGPWTAR